MWYNVYEALFPLRNFYTEHLFVLLRTKRMQLRNHADTRTASETFQALKGLCHIHLSIKFGMLQVRENEIALRKCLVVSAKSRSCAP